MLEKYKHELKPNKGAFLNYRFVLRTIFLLVFLLILGCILKLTLGVSYWYFTLAFVLIDLIIYYSLKVQYRKEKYIFLADKIIHKGGGIFSDYQTELIVKNITHVTMKLLFIENSLFKTGHLNIESAGTGLTEVYLRGIDNPKKYYEYVEKLMKYNGFKLNKSKLIQREHPSSVGIFFEIFGLFVGALVFCAASFFMMASMFLVYNENVILLTPVFLLISGILLIFLIVHYLDLKKRVYDVYSDTISYKEGFLTKNYSFIPLENLSDASVNQTFFEQIFGLYDVKISCQGSKQEILFHNIANGIEMEANIDKLIQKTVSISKITQIKDKVIKGYKSTKPLNVDKEFIAELKMNGKRTFFPLLFLIPLLIILIPITFVWAKVWFFAFYIVIAGVIGIIGLAIKVSVTKYNVKPKSMYQEYSFFNVRKKEFSNDKIMAVIFKESFIDKWFNTCSINFWSIGSAEDINFQNIKKKKGLYESILAKSGIGDQEIIYKMNPRFSFLELLKASIAFSVISVALIIASVVLTMFSLWFVFIGVGVLFLYFIYTVYGYAYYKRSKMIFYKDYVYFQKGIFFKEFYYVLYDNIKDITTTKYPFSKRGSITFNIAGEHHVGQARGRGKQQQISISNSFRIDFIEDLDNKDELIDMIFFKRPNASQVDYIEGNIEKYSPKPILKTKQDLGNSFVLAVIPLIFVFALISVMFWASANNPEAEEFFARQVLFISFSMLISWALGICAVLIVILIVWSVKVRSYSVQPYRVLAKSGIVYKKQTSIVFNKIDHISSSQGFLNKIFGNGNIKVNTTGSPKPELEIHNVKRFREFYDVLKKFY